MDVAVGVDVAHRAVVEVGDLVAQRALVSHVGRVGEVDAVVVVSVEVEIPALDAVFQAQAHDGQRGSALSHAFVPADVVGHVALVREHVDDVGVGGVFGLGDGTQEVDGEVAGHLELHAQLGAVVVLLYAGHADVGERVHVVEVEVLPLCALGRVAVVGSEVHLQPFVVDGVAQLTGESLLVAQVVHEVVVHLGADEGDVDLRCALLVACAHAEGLSAAQVHVGAHLEAAVDEAGLAALAVGVVLADSVLHLAVAPHVGAAHLGGDEAVAAQFVACETGPHGGLLHEQVIVVAEAVAFLDLAVLVAQVVVDFVGTVGIGTFGVGIAVVEVLSAQQVVHRLVVHAFVRGQLQSDVQLVALVDVPLIGASQAEEEVVVVLALDVVDGIVAAGVQLLVGEVELVEVNLAVGLRTRPQVVGIEPCVVLVAGGSRSAPHVVVVRGEALPVVGVRVGARVVELRGAVHGVAADGAGGQLHAVVNLEVPGEYGRGLVVVHDAAGALLAVLVAPVGVIQAVVGQPVGLVGRGTLLGALRGVAPRGQVQRVALVELLLQRQEVGERVVERSLHGCRVHVGPAVAHGAGKGPALLRHARAEGIHGACRVVSVGTREGHLVAGGDGAGAEVVVRRASDVRHREGVGLEDAAGIDVARGVVHAADGRVVELPVLAVVHLHAVEVDVAVARVVGAELVACRAEQVAGVAVKHVCVRVHHDDVLRHVIILAQLRFGEHEGRVVLSQRLVGVRDGVGGRLLRFLGKAK